MRTCINGSQVLSLYQGSFDLEVFL